MEFTKNECLIKHLDGTCLATVVRNSVNGLYRLQRDTLSGCSEVHNLESPVYAITSHDLSQKVALWHKRLGHFHYQGIRRMIQYGAVQGLPQMSIGNTPCQSCMLVKQSRKSIPKLKTCETTETLQLVHLDVAGPFRVKSLGGAKYFVTFIDDFSKKTWVYFLFSKDQVLDKFKLFHLESKRLSGHKLKTLRLDNGGEYTSRAFSSYCAQAGITRQFSQPYTP